MYVNNNESATIVTIPSKNIHPTQKNSYKYSLDFIYFEFPHSIPLIRGSK
jgi:hypothetical protein